MCDLTAKAIKDICNTKTPLHMNKLKDTKDIEKNLLMS